jgi:hypothetical protein
MSRARYEDWRLLDLSPGADLAEVNRALHFRRSLYHSGSLATYNLLEDDERERMLERIDEAYRRITGNEPPPTRPSQSSASTRAVDEKPAGPAPDPRSEPGALLRYHRRRRGISLEQLAADTKIRAVLIEQIEREVVEALPAAVFVRGHVLQLARALALSDPNAIAAHYLAKLKLD